MMEKSSLLQGGEPSDEELIEKMHAAGICCNLYFADTIEDFEKYFSMGIDTLLTNRMDLAAYYQKTVR